MNFITFGINNVKRNIKSYIGYFLSILISSGLLFSFNMFISHPELDITGFDDYILMMIKVTSLVAYAFLFFFVFYSVSVFLKSRYKEFGILYTIGMSKKQVVKLIFIENLVINILASIIGVLVGLIFSKIVLISISTALKIEPLEFYIPTKSMILTIVYFLFLSIAISIFTIFVIKEDKVLKLLKGTQAPKSEPKASWILATLCVVLFVVGYYLAVTVTRSNLAIRIVPVTFMIIAATYLFFSQLSVFLIKKARSIEILYNKNINMLWISNLYYKIKDNTRIFFLVTITSAVAFTAIGAIYSFWKDITRQVEMSYPYAIHYATLTEGINSNITVNLNKYKDRIQFIENELSKANILYNKIDGEIKTVYFDKNNKNVKLMKESKYIELANELNLNSININENEAISLTLLEDKKKSDTLVINDNVLKVVAQVEKPIMPAYYDIYVVKDNYYNNLNDSYTIEYFTAINTKDYMSTLSVCKKFEELYEKELQTEPYKFLSKASVLEFGKLLYSTVLFLAIFIGLIFFITSSSFLYNKIYLDCIEDKKKYAKLNKIGLTYNEIKMISTIEISILFLIPYLVAVVHSSFALIALKSSFNMEVASSAFLIMGSFFIVLFIYFLIVRQGYLNEIKEDLID